MCGIAGYMNADPDKPVNPQLLAKVVVIQSRYPKLYNDLVEYPALLQDFFPAAHC